MGARQGLILNVAPKTAQEAGNMRLTDKCLKSAKPINKTLKLFDGGGLYLEIGKNGSKLWRLKYRYSGKEKRISLGSYPRTSLKEARDKREEAKKLLDRNIDPSIARQENKNDSLTDNSNTFKVIAEEWHENEKEKWSVEHAKTIMSRIEMHLFPKIGNIPIKNITPMLLLNALKQIEKQGVYETTKRLRQYCSQVFKYAVITGRAERDVAADIIGAFKHKKVEHHAALNIVDLPAFLRKLERNDARLYFETRIAIKLMLLTFVRTSELLKAKWNEFNIDNKTWIIPAERMKMRKAHTVPLSNQVIDILKQLKLHNGEREYILSSPVAPKKHISVNTILYALYRLGYKGKATGHGFRALAMTTILENMDYSFDVVDAQLAHSKRNPLGAAYDRAQYLKERKQMMQDWADYIEGI